jgi:hypothetical protein
MLQVSLCYLDLYETRDDGHFDPAVLSASALILDFNIEELSGPELMLNLRSKPIN